MFYRVVLLLPMVVFGYLLASGRLQAYWHAFSPMGVPMSDDVFWSNFLTAGIWVASLAPLLFAVWDLGRQHRAAYRFQYHPFVGLRDVVLLALSRDISPERAAAYARAPRDNPLIGLLLGALVACGVPVFFLSTGILPRTSNTYVWLGGAGLLLGVIVYCNRRAAAYLVDEPGRWDIFGKYRLLNPSRYEPAGRVFVKWQIAAYVILPFWWLGGGAVVLFQR